MICRICGNDSGNKSLLAREMYFGSREAFTYLECSSCGCLQIVDPPHDMKNAYPSDYHSYEKPSALMTAAEKKKATFALFEKGIIGRLLYHRNPDTLFKLLSKASLSTDSRILDVGCGSGRLLDLFRGLGFTSLRGIDPYAKVNGYRGIRIDNKTIEDLSDNDKFDVIIFDQSFEHIPDHLGTLQKVSKLLAHDGLCVIRMPVKTEYFWNRYGVKWYGLDAPRHLIIHTAKSFELLTKKANLIVHDMTFDTNWLGIAGSEQYTKDIPARSRDSGETVPKRGIFKAKQIREFKKIAKQLKSEGQGDNVSLCLRKRD